MPYYISEYEGDGTNQSPFLPAARTSGWSAIDLRPDGGATLGGGGLNACLLWLPNNVVNAKLLKFAEAKGENLSTNTKNSLISRLNLTAGFFELNKTEDIISELLLKPPDKAWNPIRKGENNTIKIYLGGLLVTLPGSSAQLQMFLENAKMFVGFLGAALGFPLATVLDENFNGTDSVTLANTQLSWAEYTAGEVEWQQLSNQLNLAVLNVGNFAENGLRVESDLASDDHYAEIDWVSVSGALTRTSGPTVRQASGSTITHYGFIYIADAATVQLAKMVSGSFTDIGGGAVAYTISGGDTFRIEADGSTQDGLVNGSSKRTGTDTAITGNLRAGMRGLGEGTSTGNIIWDTWKAEDLAAARRRIPSRVF